MDFGEGVFAAGPVLRQQGGRADQSSAPLRLAGANSLSICQSCLLAHCSDTMRKKRPRVSSERKHVIYGSAYGAFSPLRASVMADHFGRRAYGAITAVQGIPVAVCAGLGPLAAGWLYDGLHRYEVAFWLCAGAFLLAAIGIGLTPRPGERQAVSAQARAVMEEDLAGGRG